MAIPESSNPNPVLPILTHTHVLSKVAIPKSRVLLATAWIQVSSKAGRNVYARALIDQGSVATLITESLAQRLRVPRDRIFTSLTGIGNAQTSVKHAVEISVSPRKQTDPAYSTTAFVLPSLTRYTPERVQINPTWSHVTDLKLADSNPMSSEPIDVIIGADLYGLILLEGVRKGFSNEPIAQNSIFGWILSGPVSTHSFDPSVPIHSHHGYLSTNLDVELRRFWEVEELPRKTHLTPDEQKCEDHFISTHSRNLDGRYVVHIPFKQGPPIDIGESQALAQSLLLRSEKRFLKNPDLSKAYSEFLQDYENLGHMVRVLDEKRPSEPVVYLPHHAVLRESSATTRVRVVFNASSSTTNKTSLNDHMLIGPKLQTELPAILLRWRMFNYVYTADIKQMYRQILIDPRDRDYQRILWRSSPSNPISHFQLNTVTYGTASAPFLALRVLQQVAIDEGSRFPLALDVLRRHIYIDDCVFGADDQQQAIFTRDQLIALLRTAGFELRKWASNSDELLADIDPSFHGLAQNKRLDDDRGLTILGIAWNSQRDSFTFNVELVKVDFKTKRDVLSAIAKIFDPLGWITPIVIKAKIFMQNLWRLKGGWDDILSPELKSEWLAFYTQLSQLIEISIPRWTGFRSNSLEYELHGFADASIVAYGAVVYLRIHNSAGEVVTSLLAAKSKVAPIKTMTVPRLELSAALLLARLMTFVRDTLDLPQVSTHCWTDSTITLAWLKKYPSQLKTFIANRVDEIQTRLPHVTWHHVPTHENPADCSSRGLSVQELLKYSLWWNGPYWLRMNNNCWPDHSPALAKDAPLELNSKILVHTSQLRESWDLANRYSSWLKLLRVTAYVIRFITNTRVRLHLKKSSERTIPQTDESTITLRTTEIEQARIYWIKYIQTELFTNDKRRLVDKQPLEKKSAILSLNPYLDAQGVLRVGGRLENSSLPQETKHPIILSSHPLVSLLVSHVHLRGLHAGTQLTLRLLREKYWIIRARATIRAILYTCVICARERASVPSELMGDLPEVRVTRSSRPFLHCGLDYAGPILARTSPGRGHKSIKTYIALFVCMTTKALHLELVSDYSSAAFLAAFRRFCSRRGLPNTMYSDNGRTFVGADRELAESFKALMRDSNVASKFADDNITWHFLPPSAPHFGGLWEAGVRSFKHHFKRVVGNHTLTFEELTTLLCQIEACLNSRPIAPLSDRVDDYVALTPGHFLIGSALLAVPEPSLLDFSENRLTRWQLVRQMNERVWESWRHDYLHTLQQRTKWQLVRKQVQLGQIVLLRDSLTPPCKWNLGRITACHPGPDGLIRVVTVRTANSEYKRPIAKLCLLPIDLKRDSEDDQSMAGGDTQTMPPH